MMEHANLHQHHHHHQLQDGQLELSGSSSSSNSSMTTAPSSYGGAAGSTHGWTQNFNLNVDSFNPNCHGVILNPRPKNINDPVLPSIHSSMIQNLSPHNWLANNVGGSFTSQSSPEDLLNLAGIREDLSDTNFPKFTDMLSTSSPSSIEDSRDLSYIKSEQKDIADLSEKLLLKTITSPGFPLNGHHHFTRGGGIYSPSTQDCSSSGIGVVYPSRSGNFSQIYPSINISNLNQASPSLLPASFDMNSEALDLLNSTRFSGSFGHACQDSLSTYTASPSSLGLEQIQSSPRSSSSPSKISSPFNNEITSEPKRSRSSSSLTESNKASTQAAPKKSRALEPRAACPPFKVRKEKLGDRVAALQQLVAPFGKTDTASVLMEAIGYIRFLQNQVEVLSVPYMKSSRNKSSRSGMHTGSANNDIEDGKEEPERDLRSRGLCLVPLSCMSYVTSVDGGNNVGGGIWPPPNFGGGT